MVAEWYFDVLSSHQSHESLLRFLFLFPKRVPSQIYLSQSLQKIPQVRRHFLAIGAYFPELPA